MVNYAVLQRTGVWMGCWASTKANNVECVPPLPDFPYVLTLYLDLAYHFMVSSGTFRVFWQESLVCTALT